MPSTSRSTLPRCRDRLGGPLARLSGAVHADDGLAQGNIVKSVAPGRHGLSTLADAVVEVDQLLLEALVEGRDLLSPRRAGRLGLAGLLDQHGGHAAEKWRRKREGEPAVRGVERELHLISSDARKVDPRKDALRGAVLEDRGEGGLADV